MSVVYLVLVILLSLCLPRKIISKFFSWEEKGSAYNWDKEILVYVWQY